MLSTADFFSQLHAPCPTAVTLNVTSHLSVLSLHPSTCYGTFLDEEKGCSGRRSQVTSGTFEVPVNETTRVKKKVIGGYAMDSYETVLGHVAMTYALITIAC